MIAEDTGRTNVREQKCLAVFSQEKSICGLPAGGDRRDSVLESGHQRTPARVFSAACEMCPRLRVFCKRPKSPSTVVCSGMPKRSRASTRLTGTHGILEPTGRCLIVFRGNHFASLSTQGSVAVKMTSDARARLHNCVFNSSDKAADFQP